jgi:hypothetical protein
MNIQCRPSSISLTACLIAVTVFAFFSCGGGGGGGGDGTSNNTPEPTNFDKAYEKILAVDEYNGLLMPQIKAGVDSDGIVHIAFYSSSEAYPVDSLPPGDDLAANPFRYQIRHVEVDPSRTDPSTGDYLVLQEETIDVSPPHDNNSGPLAGDSGIDNCNVLGLSFSNGNTPVVVYQGGNRPQSAGGLQCNPFYQGDLMVNVRSGNVWQEYLGIQGDGSVKNPLFTDGMAGMAGDVAVDASGNIHMIVQHYYEWCDLHGTTFPDLLYVRQSPSDLGHYSTAMEEWVDEHNIYGGGGGIENASGYYCKIILDNDGRPAVFFFATLANGSRQIRVSRKIEGSWQASTVYALPDDYAVSYISPAVASENTMGVAFNLRSISDHADFGDHLCYAQLQADGTWSHTKVDYSSYCGKACVLAFDNNNRPAIVYYDERPYTQYRERKDVKFAFFDGRQWQKEIAANEGDIGLYNALWFNASNVAHICTYMQDMHKVMVFRRKMAN